MQNGDYPIDEVEQRVKLLMGDGHSFYQKYTCEECGARLVMSKPNTLYSAGVCDICEHTTRITQCGYLAVLKGGAK
jgi:hypothetical protein